MLPLGLLYMEFTDAIREGDRYVAVGSSYADFQVQQLDRLLHRGF